MSLKLTTNQYIEKCKIIHRDTYDYSVTKYVNSTTKVQITCRIHGCFEQWPSDHRRGFGCPQCSGKARSSTSIFIQKAKAIHGEFYNYDSVDYLSLDKPIDIVCPKHGVFSMMPRHHIYGSKNGCGACQRSKGEVAIKLWLLDHNISFEEQKVLSNLPSKRFDFYIPSLNLCIEFDGAQHFHVRHQKTRDPLEAIKRFTALQVRDNEKTQFCLHNNISLLRISYQYLKTINQILDHAILCHSSS
jgi:very-short-patch-repair endonuclease